MGSDYTEEAIGEEEGTTEGEDGRPPLEVVDLILSLVVVVKRSADILVLVSLVTR